MNLNEYPEELRIEEQRIADEVIETLESFISSLEEDTRALVEMASKVMHSANPDKYVDLIVAKQGIKDSNEDIKKLNESRDTLYNSRLLMNIKDDIGTTVEEVKVGLHTVMKGDRIYIQSWKTPFCRHFVSQGNNSTFEGVVTDKSGTEYNTTFNLIVRNDIKFRFSRVRSAINMFPGIFTKEDLENLKGKGYFHDDYIEKMISLYNPDDYDPDSAAKLIVDAFLQDLLERRSDAEFRNIVFSIQKKQSEIIQVPFDKNILVQGCAGSGKSMIMLHRLPIVLYDNPQSLNHSNIFIITPSEMYIQMVENMRRDLEITDINMGTMNQYYDHCLEKYTQYKKGDYGTIVPVRLSHEQEKYAYSEECVTDIKDYIGKQVIEETTPLDRACNILEISIPVHISEESSFAKSISNRIAEMQTVLNKNESILRKYFKQIRTTIEAFIKLCTALEKRTSTVERGIKKKIWSENKRIDDLNKVIDMLDKDKNAIAIKNRENEIEAAKSRIELMNDVKMNIDKDTEYFNDLTDISMRVMSYIGPLNILGSEYGNCSSKQIYDVIGQTGNIIGLFYGISWEISRVGDKYIEYATPIGDLVKEVKGSVDKLQKITDRYIDYDYFSKLNEERDALSFAGNNAVKQTYNYIMGKLGAESDKKGEMNALICSPYLYLQIMYQYHGVPNAAKESLLSIDEAQGVAPQEIKLLDNINDKKAVFNLFGDERQHIEQTKGMDSWSEMSEILDFERFDMDENYRNASQITEYCNRRFKMKMRAINTTGKGVHEMNTLEEFYNEMISQLTDAKHAGLGAIIVKENKEAQFLLDVFGAYGDKFKDLTGEDFTLHRTRWNIMTVADAKGLEFNSVIVLTGRMSINEQYIACTRALDELMVYTVEVDISKYERIENDEASDAGENNKNTDANTGEDNNNGNINDASSVISNADTADTFGVSDIVTESAFNPEESAVAQFFKSKGLHITDKRINGDKLYVFGEKGKLEPIIEEAIDLFEISGKYGTVKDKPTRRAWYTKTRK